MFKKKQQSIASWPFADVHVERPGFDMIDDLMIHTSLKKIIMKLV